MILQEGVLQEKLVFCIKVYLISVYKICISFQNS